MVSQELLEAKAVLMTFHVAPLNNRKSSVVGEVPMSPHKLPPGSSEQPLVAGGVHVKLLQGHQPARTVLVTSRGNHLPQGGGGKGVLMASEVPLVAVGDTPEPPQDTPNIIIDRLPLFEVFV